MATDPEMMIPEEMMPMMEEQPMPEQMPPEMATMPAEMPPEQMPPPVVPMAEEVELGPSMPEMEEVEELAEVDYLDNEDMVKEVLKEANTSFEDFKSSRRDYEDMWQVSDYMYKCAQNSTIMEQEREKGVNNDEDSERANTGSTMFFRQNNQLTSAGMSVIKSQDIPFKYKPIINEGVFISPEDCLAQTEQWNCLAEWNMEVDKFITKMYPLFHDIFKYGNVPVMVEWRRERGERSVRVPQYEGVVDENGLIKPVLTGYANEKIDAITKNYLTWRKLPVDCVFADPYVPTLEGQDTVVILSLRNIADIRGDSKFGYFSSEKVMSISDKEKWDGATNKEFVKQKMENNGINSPTVSSDVYLVWDIFKRIPIVDNKIDPENGEYDWRLITVVGNSIGQGIPIRFIDNPDPDKELPIIMLHDLPDDEDEVLYHMSRSQAVRSNYSTECTLKNQMIDNGALVNDPPMIEIEGMVRGTDRSFEHGQVFTVDQENALTAMPITPLAQMNIQLIEYIKSDSKMALSTDSLMMGEAAGSRTSATEISKLDKYSSAPILITIDYILQQFLGFYARKLMSYWKKYKIEDQVVAITDQPSIKDIKPKELYGEFDIKISIVDEFYNDMVEQSNIAEAFTLIAQNPALAAVVELPELMTQWFKKKKLDYTKLVKRSTDFDARIVAEQENRLMMDLSKPATVGQGENSNAHLVVHEGERVKYLGVEEQFPQLILLERHIAETKNAISSQGSQQSAPLPGSANASTPGQVSGDQLAGAMAGGAM